MEHIIYCLLDSHDEFIRCSSRPNKVEIEKNKVTIEKFYRTKQEQYRLQQDVTMFQYTACDNKMYDAKETVKNCGDIFCDRYCLFQGVLCRMPVPSVLTDIFLYIR